MAYEQNTTKLNCKRLRKMPAPRPTAFSDERQAARQRSGGKGRPPSGETRRAYFTASQLRSLVTFLERAALKLPGALRVEADRQAAVAAAHLVELQQRRPAQGGRKKGEGMNEYYIARADEPITYVKGVAAVAKALRRSEGYIRVKMSQGGGVAKLPCQDRNGNPAIVEVARVLRSARSMPETENGDTSQSGE